MFTNKFSFSLLNKGLKSEQNIFYIPRVVSVCMVVMFKFDGNKSQSVNTIIANNIEFLKTY